MAGVTGLEPATSGVTGRRSNQLSYTPLLEKVTLFLRDFRGVCQPLFTGWASHGRCYL
jgi:hypothetical protein